MRASGVAQPERDGMEVAAVTIDYPQTIRDRAQQSRSHDHARKGHYDPQLPISLLQLGEIMADSSENAVRLFLHFAVAPQAARRCQCIASKVRAFITEVIRQKMCELAADRELRESVIRLGRISRFGDCRRPCFVFALARFSPPNA